MQSLFTIEKTEKDLYSILNCVDTSSPEQIKTEYKRLALKYHPDKSLSGSINGTYQHKRMPLINLLFYVDSKEFQKIKGAYEIVGDPVNRALYERWKSSNLIIPFSEFAQIGTHAQVRSLLIHILPSKNCG
ncbi:unnamed protein product [Mucor fragilis]